MLVLGLVIRRHYYRSHLQVLGIQVSWFVRVVAEGLVSYASAVMVPLCWAGDPCASTSTG